MKKREDKRQQMFALVEQFSSSGLTRGEFSKTEGLSASTLNYWLRRYKEKQDLPNDFVSIGEINVEPGYCIKFPNGVELHTDVEPSMSLIEKIGGYVRE